MGRTEQSQGLAPPSIRKDTRAKQARVIVNKTIPALLASNGRARKGVEGSELIVDPAPLKWGGEGLEDVVGERESGKRKGKRRAKKEEDEEKVVRAGKGDHEEEDYTKRKGQGRRRRDKSSSISLPAHEVPIPPSSPTKPHEHTRKKPITIRILNTDTLTASHHLTFPPCHTSHPQKASKKPATNTCILNMASPLRPGGGVLNGATSQEEFLCARTTLLPSLKDSFYRLPEIGGMWTSDVLVFRNAEPLGEGSGELGVNERWWVDVVSAGMLRFPEVEERDGVVGYVDGKDRVVVERKMRGVLRICCRKGVKKLVLGAWGCGAYGNPVAEVAGLWRKVLFGDENRKGKGGGEAVERWEGVEEVVFAITNKKMAEDFAKFFGNDIEIEEMPGGDIQEEEEEDENRDAIKELRSKIQEMESQISQVWNPDLKSRMNTILDDLRAQLRKREAVNGDRTKDEISSDESVVEEDEYDLIDSQGSGDIEDTDEGGGYELSDDEYEGLSHHG